MSATKILWGQILTVFLIVLATTWGATEWVAWRLAFQPELGAPWFTLFGVPVYFPAAIMWWWYFYDAYAPGIFAVGGVIAAPVRWTGNAVNYVKGYFFAVSENRRLRAQIVELNAWRDDALALKNVNARYEQMLGVKTEPPVAMVTGLAITDARGPFNQARLLNVGAAKGVRSIAAADRAAPLHRGQRPAHARHMPPRRGAIIHAPARRLRAIIPPCNMPARLATPCRSGPDGRTPRPNGGWTPPSSARGWSRPSPAASPWR